MLMIPVSSRAIQGALTGEIQFMWSGGVANINANMSGGDFVGITSTISSFVFKIIRQPGIKEPSRLKGKRVGTSRVGGASDFSLRYALDCWGLVPEKDVAIMQIGGEAEAVLVLQNKAVDAAMISEPFTTIAQLQDSAWLPILVSLKQLMLYTASAHAKALFASAAMSWSVS